MFREQGVDVNNNFRDVNQPERSMRPAVQQAPAPVPPQSGPGPRPEMRGPQSSDIDNILSGLKTRTIDIHETPDPAQDDSMISISSLKDMQNSNGPKRSRRKNRSDKNTVSLDI
jgi:hypothetical protein